ncbi:hypothetical protein MRX96_007923 [Rhipicephalus microplus]
MVITLASHCTSDRARAKTSPRRSERVRRSQTSPERAAAIGERRLDDREAVDAPEAPNFPGGGGCKLGERFGANMARGHVKGNPRQALLIRGEKYGGVGATKGDDYS